MRKFSNDPKHQYLSEYDKKFCRYDNSSALATGHGNVLSIALFLFVTWKARSLSKKYGKKFFPLLTEQEKEILFLHIKDRMQDDPLRADEETLKSLVNKNFVYYGLNFDNTAMFYYVQHWAWPFLKKKFKERKK